MPAVVLLPVFKPGDTLLALIGDLLRDGRDPATVVIVDDGSGPAADQILATIRESGATVLRHDTNQGKGAAIKTGFRYALKSRPGHDVITADGDGQHHAPDISALAERVGDTRIVLGVRRLDKMPPRSRIGNTLTAGLFRLVTGRTVSDTQTGLRAYPAALLEPLCAIPGDRFEYEMNVLLAAARAGYTIDELPVPTTYLADNAASNFAGLTDSARVWSTLLRPTPKLPAATLTP